MQERVECHTMTQGVKLSKDLVYERAGERQLTLDLYWHDAAKQATPLIVWVHGGGWRVGDKSDVMPALLMLNGGFAVASIGYRLSQEAIFPAQIEDCKAAVRWLRAHAGAFRLDPTHFGAWGPSAGGHLAALVGVSGRVREWDQFGGHQAYTSQVQAVCDWFGPTDLLRMNDIPGAIDHDAVDSPESELLGGPIQENIERARRANPITYASALAPPFLIMHGDRDDIVPVSQSQLLHQALREVGVESTLVLVEGAGHGLWRPDGEQVALVDRVLAFFTRHLRSHRFP